ncbi:putative mRNA interferase [Syntrophobacter sp. SbD1]|nr:putative mRNA interferase [Syntrophobacter sp. SbD1]
MMNRGDVWRIDLGGKAGTRPVVVLARQNVLDYLQKVVVAEITTKSQGYPTEVFIDQRANLLQPSFVQTDCLHTVAKNALQKYLGSLDSETMQLISQKVVFALQLESCSPQY